MKTKLLFVLLVVFSAGTLKAQTDSTYHLQHFLPDSAQFMDCDLTYYIIAGDTVINEKKMKKTYVSSLEHYYAAIYEDTLNAKYYAVYKNSTKEILFMDFSVNKGDKVYLPLYYDDDEPIDSTWAIAESVYFDESGRKVVEMTNGWEFSGWVEGIGSLVPILFEEPFKFKVIREVNDPSLAKVVVGDSIVYERFTAEQCEYFKQFKGVNINTETEVSISTYPNPAKDFLIIDAQDYDCHTYEIISAFGTVEQSGALLPSIDISRLPVGVKVIVIKDDNGNVLYTSRFIKK